MATQAPAAAQGTSLPQRLAGALPILIAGASVMLVVLMIVPIPPFLLDVLLSVNIALALIIIATALYTENALAFSAFPTLLLIITLFRLSLNITATRAILLHGYAGEVINFFGQIVVGGNYAVGFVIFLILIIIQFVVITNGAGRVAEVAARFTLDAMPGKQLAIDADLNAGLINQEIATQRRREVAHEADFFGAMDGASKFVRGDAIAAILILFINLIGGLIIGAWQHGMTLAEAAQNYTLLTIGDGLVAQIPALVISVAAGLVVSRVSTDRDIGREVVAQLAAFPKLWWIAGAIVGLFGIVPGMPHLPFLGFGAMLGLVGWRLYRQAEEVEKARSAPPPAKATENEELDVGVVELVEPLEIEIGYRLVSLVDKEKNGTLLRRLRAVRKQVSREFGFLVPVVHVRDNPDLNASSYRIMVYGVERATGEVYPDRLMAIPSERLLGDIQGIKARDPVFGRAAVWIAPAMADQARAAGHTVFDAAVVVATHFERVVKNHVEALFGRSELDAVLAVVSKQSPKLIEELTPKLLPLSTVHKILCSLLAERIPLRSLRTIVATLIEEASGTQDVKSLLKALRIRLAGFIIQHVFGAVDELKLMALEPELERLFQDTLRLAGETTEEPSLEPGLAGDVRAMASAAALRLENIAPAAALVVRPEIRLFVSQLLRSVRPWIWVFSYAEIPPEKRIKVVELLGRQPEKGANVRR